VQEYSASVMAPIIQEFLYSGCHFLQASSEGILAGIEWLIRVEAVCKT
jgi:hypothetical protein